jgi:putative tryptophan/tyrosine transport system substrate-binding protein
VKRRELLLLLTGAVILAPRPGRAQQARGQQPGRTYRIGGLYSSPREAPQHIALFEELRRLGFIDGQNLTIDPRGFGLRNEQFLQAAVELVNAGADVILAGGNPAIRAAQQATATIPILGLTDDMVGSGLAASMAHPGANTTGISLLATEFDGKRQELLIELIPEAHRIAALIDPNTTASWQLQPLRDVARAHDVDLDIQTAGTPEEITPAIDAAKASGAAGLNVLASPIFFANRRLIFERAAALRLPAIYQWPEMAREGGLAGYGPSIVQLFREVLSRQLVKLLAGTKPADLPVEQPTKFELVINVNAAKALGLAIPRPMLMLADEVIE